MVEPASEKFWVTFEIRFAAWFSSDAPRQAGGHDLLANGFFLQQVEMSLGASVDPFLRFPYEARHGLETRRFPL